MEYKIYPCDLTMYGECPKEKKDCANCAYSIYQYNLQEKNSEKYSEKTLDNH